MTDLTNLSVGLHYDLRNPFPHERDVEDLTAAVIDQVVRAEEVGFRSVWFSEHHFKADGENPSPLLLAAAVAARTERLRISTDLIILPLTHPLRLAEDAAMLAILSRGRFDLGIAGGYIENDLLAYGQRLSRRPSLMEEGVAIIRSAWSGEPFRHSGRRFTVPEITVAPLPQPAHRPRLLMGGFAPAAVERAARLADGFLAGDPGSIAMYRKALERSGRHAEAGWVGTTLWWIVASDPEAAWARIGDYGLYQTNQYIEAGVLGDMAPFTSPDALLARGQYELHDADSAIARLKELRFAAPELADVHFFGMLPGESVDSGAERIEYIGAELIPRLQV
jgi:alkanesulfonate monooxygenase SsuD/methylene tetrahydromethanopterin reductase-like flavin-dependent oxidoreductase (luciferase family)